MEYNLNNIDPLDDTRDPIDLLFILPDKYYDKSKVDLDNMGMWRSYAIQSRDSMASELFGGEHNPYFDTPEKVNKMYGQYDSNSIFIFSELKDSVKKLDKKRPIYAAIFAHLILPTTYEEEGVRPMGLSLKTLQDMLRTQPPEPGSWDEKKFGALPSILYDPEEDDQKRLPVRPEEWNQITSIEPEKIIDFAFWMRDRKVLPKIDLAFKPLAASVAISRRLEFTHLIAGLDTRAFNLLTSAGMFGTLEQGSKSVVVGVDGNCIARLGAEVQYYGSSSCAMLAHIGLANEIAGNNTFMQGELIKAENSIDALPLNIEY